MEVVSGSPADKAGLQVGDIITAVNGQTVDAQHALSQLIQQSKAGDTVKLTVQRGTGIQTISVTLGTSPDNNSAPYLGIRFTMIEPQQVPSATSG